MPTIAIVSENLKGLIPVGRKIQEKWPVELYSWDRYKNTTDIQSTVIVFDVNLRDSKTIEKLRKLLAKKKNNVITIFYVTSTSNRTEVIQANSLGSMIILERPVKAETLIQKIYLFDLINSNNPQLLKASSSEAFDAMSLLLDSFKKSIKDGDNIEAKPVYDCSEKIIRAVNNDEVDALLTAIRTHHSHTYRHSMAVSVYGTAFAVQYNMKNIDATRITVGALLHDIGKSMISPKILNKSTRLNEMETIIMRQHTVNGANLLARSRNFDQEVINIARHHHEHLDGTGYPDGIKGRRLGDVVRIIAICDRYVSLTEPANLEKAIEPEGAFEILLRQRGKIDLDLLRAFRPVALSKENNELSKKLRSFNAA